MGVDEGVRRRSVLISGEVGVPSTVGEVGNALLNYNARVGDVGVQGGNLGFAITKVEEGSMPTRVDLGGQEASSVQNRSKCHMCQSKVE